MIENNASGRLVFHVETNLSSIICGSLRQRSSKSLRKTLSFSSVPLPYCPFPPPPSSVVLDLWQAEGENASVPFTPMLQRTLMHKVEEDVKPKEACDTSFSTGERRRCLGVYRIKSRETLRAFYDTCAIVTIPGERVFSASPPSPPSPGMRMRRTPYHGGSFSFIAQT